MDCDQRRRACRVDRDARSAKIQQVRNPVGRDAQRVAGSRVRVDTAEIAELRPAVIVVRDSHEDAGLAAGKRLDCLPRVFQCFPGHFEQQALLRVHSRSFARRDAEKLRIELIHLLDKAAPSRADFARHSWIRIVNLVEIEAVGRHFRDCVHAVANRLPELPRTAAAGKPAADSNDRDRLGFRLASSVGSRLIRRAAQMPSQRFDRWELVRQISGDFLSDPVAEFAREADRLGRSHSVARERFPHVDFSGRDTEQLRELIDQPFFDDLRAISVLAGICRRDRRVR